MERKNINEQIIRLAAELISELAKATPEDYLQIKLMMLSVARLPKIKSVSAENVLSGRGETAVIA